MMTENIIEIGIDELERLYVIPEKKRFTLVWRSATEVLGIMLNTFYILLNQVNGVIMIGTDIFYQPTIIY